MTGAPTGGPPAMMRGCRMTGEQTRAAACRRHPPCRVAVAGLAGVPPQCGREALMQPFTPNTVASGSREASASWQQRALFEQAATP